MSTRRFVLPVLAATVLAGCLNAPTAPPSTTEPPVVTTGAWRLDCALANWNETCNARASFNDAPSKTEIDLVVNPTDPLNVFVASKDLDPLASDCVWSVGYWTKDGGRTWNTTYVGGTLEERSSPTHPLHGWNCVTDPIMAFDSQGVLYYPLQAYDLSDALPTGLPIPGGLPVPVPVGTGSSFFLAVSRDGGQTFPAEDIELMAVAEGGLVFHDYPRMAVSPATDSVSTVWNAVGAAGINPYVVTVRGGMIGPPVVVELPGEARSTQFASGYAAGSDGTFYMTVRGANNPGVWLARSTDDGQRFDSFAPMFEVSDIPNPLPNTEFRTFTAIELAADATGGARDGRLWAAWADYARNNSDILVAWSDDHGDTWTEPVRVTDSANDQFMVRATVSADGALHLLYMDRQHDPGNRRIDFTHSYTEDGGVSWFHQRLTTASFDGDLGIHQAGFPFIGDYNGIGSAGDHTWFAFPTTQSGRAEVAVAHAVRTNSTAAPAP